METFKVGFFEDVTENDSFNFEECNSIEAFDAKEAAYKFAESAYSSKGMHKFDNDDIPWNIGSDDCIEVKDKDGHIFTFFVYVSTITCFKCEELPF